MNATSERESRTVLFRERSWRRRQLPTAVAFLLAATLFTVVSIYSPGFASSLHISSLIEQASILGIVAIGQTFAILTGGIDLSAPAMMSVAGVLLAREAPTNADLWKALVIVFTIALIVGLVNGISVAIFRAPAIIVTLGMQGVLVGGLLVTVQGGITGNGTISGIVRSIATDRIGAVPVAGIVWLAMIIFISLLLARSPFGRRVYAVGNNAIAARISGVNVPATIIAAYVISAISSALAGFMLAGYLGQSYPNMGSEYLFTAIAAVLVGGASILGGSGNYLGTVAGAFTLTVLGGLLAILNLGPAILRILYGVIIFGTVGVATIVSKSGDSHR